MDDVFSDALGVKIVTRSNGGKALEV